MVGLDQGADLSIPTAEPPPRWGREDLSISEWGEGKLEWLRWICRKWKAMMVDLHLFQSGEWKARMVEMNLCGS